MIDLEPRERGRTTLSERDKEKGDLLIKLTTFLNHHWEPSVYNVNTNGKDIMCVGFISSNGEFIQLDWFIDKLSAYLGTDAETAVQKFNSTTSHIMTEIGFDPSQYLYMMVSPEIIYHVKEDLSGKIKSYDDNHRESLKEHFTATLLDIDTPTASSMLKWAEC